MAWAEAHHRRTRRWPKRNSGPIAGAPHETWSNVDRALYLGYRGLPGGSSLARLLERRRGVRNKSDLPPLSKKRILAWADAHYRRTGSWPRVKSGPILDAPGDTWSAVDAALREALRGFRNPSSLAQLIEEKRGVRNSADLPLLTQGQILRWADAHHKRTGLWPTRSDGSVRGSKGEDWSTIDGALRNGMRGLPGDSSLARLLDAKRGTHLAKWRRNPAPQRGRRRS